jgi:hypothetical protein
VRLGLDRSGPNVTVLRMPATYSPKKVSVCLVAVPEVAAWVLHGFYEVCPTSVPAGAT